MLVMFLSKLFTRTSKESASDADSINADLLTRAGFIHKTMAGAYSYLPLGYRVLHNIETVIREEMDAIGGQEILMSALSPKANWEKTKRWEPADFDVLFRVPAASDQEYALNPTHEEIVVPLVKEYVRSYRDLPFGCYQIQTKFRNEARAKSGILRGREFLMKDLYSFHTDQESLNEYYQVVQGAYEKIFERLGLSAKTYLTYASGGSFSKYSHEYQVVLPQGEDHIFISEEAEKKGMRIAINKEIYEEGTTVCPVTGGKEFREERASEAANIFKLGTKFSVPFDLTFTDQQGEKHPMIMGCYGMGVSRLMGILVEAMSDEHGMIWSSSIAPASMHIVPVAKSTEDEAYMKALELLQKHGAANSLFDDRLDLSVGARLADADLIGIPYRVLLSPKSLEQGGAEVKERATGEVRIVPLNELA